VIEHSIDNGFVLAGGSRVSGTQSMILVKTNSVGVVLWTKTYDGTVAYSVIEHSIDQGLVFAGSGTSLGTSNFVLVKTNSVGVELWTKNYGGTGRNDNALAVIEHSIDNGFVLAGETRSTGASKFVMLVKTDSLGVMLWAKAFGGNNQDNANSVVEHSIDQGLVAAGTTLSYGAGPWDMILIKTDSVGVELWTKTFGGINLEDGNSVIEHSLDTGFVLAGWTDSVGAGNRDYMLVKTDSVGVEQWTKTYGGANDEEAFSVVEHSIDQGFVIAGWTDSVGAGNEDYMLLKTDSAGVEQWTKTYGGTSYDYAYCVVEHSVDQGLVIVGSTSSYGAGVAHVMLVVQPSDGSGTGAGAIATPTEGIQTLDEADQTITEVIEILTESDGALTDADQTITTIEVFANPSQSPSASVSVTVSQSPSQTTSQTASQTASQLASQTSSKADLVLCPDGTKHKTCPSGHAGDDADEHFMIALIILTPVFFTCCFVLVLCRQKKEEEKEEETCDVELDRI
jgi:microcompartment protein CcmK/EutM